VSTPSSPPEGSTFRTELLYLGVAIVVFGMFMALLGYMESLKHERIMRGCDVEGTEVAPWR